MNPDDIISPMTPEERKRSIQRDNVNNPAHYGQGKIECIDYILDFLTYEEAVGYLRGNMTKYLHRWRDKGGIEDLRKADWYLHKLLEYVEEKV